jgi:hypothetical protein
MIDELDRSLREHGADVIVRALPRCVEVTARQVLVHVDADARVDSRADVLAHLLVGTKNVIVVRVGAGDVANALCCEAPLVSALRVACVYLEL